MGNIGIGSTVWVFDINHRVYHKNGERHRLIWREHWRPRKIVADTRVSWILDDSPWRPANATRVPKKNASTYHFAFSEDDINERAYVNEHRHRIGDLVRSIDNADLLRQVAALVGYEAKRAGGGGDE